MNCFGRLKIYFDSLANILENTPVNSDEIMSKVDEAVSKIKRWKYQNIAQSVCCLLGSVLAYFDDIGSKLKRRNASSLIS